MNFYLRETLKKLTELRLGKTPESVSDLFQIIESQCNFIREASLAQEISILFNIVLKMLLLFAVDILFFMDRFLPSEFYEKLPSFNPSLLKGIISLRGTRIPRNHQITISGGREISWLKKFENNHCQICKNIIETSAFQSFPSKKVPEINHRFTRSVKCLVFPLLCKVYCTVCGQTNDEFRRR